MCPYGWEDRRCPFDAAKVLGELPEATGVSEGERERKHLQQLAGYYVDKLCKKGQTVEKNPAGRTGWSGKYTRALPSPPDGSLADTGVRRPWI